MADFKDKVVWITGASSGIGEALALTLAKAGARLVLTARRAEELERVKRLTGLPEQDVMVLPMDVTQFDEAAPAAAKVIQYFRRIDYMVHNAGISQRSYVKDTSLEVYRRLMDVDFFSTVALTKAVLPYMLQQQGGHFVVISSVAGKIGTPMRSGYNAAKHALHGFYDSLRAESHDSHIKVTIVCPGYIKTNVSINALDETGQKHGKMDENQEKGLSAQECAERIVEAVRQEKNEVYIGGFTEVAAVYLKRFWPALLYRMVRKQAPQ